MKTLTNVSTGGFAQKTPSVKIQLVTILVNVMVVTMEFSAQISMSAHQVVGGFSIAGNLIFSRSVDMAPFTRKKDSFCPSRIHNVFPRYVNTSVADVMRMQLAQIQRGAICVHATWVTVEMGKRVK